MMHFYLYSTVLDWLSKSPGLKDYVFSFLLKNDIWITGVLGFVVGLILGKWLLSLPKLVGIYLLFLIIMLNQFISSYISNLIYLDFKVDSSFGMSMVVGAVIYFLYIHFSNRTRKNNHNIN
jgi:hypothetical protein